MSQNSGINTPEQQRYAGQQRYDGRESGRERYKMPIIYFMAGCCCCCMVWFIIILLSFLARLSKENQSRQPGRQSLDSQSIAKSIDDRHGKMRNFNESQRACNAEHRYLPFPSSQEEEDEIVEEIRSTVNDSCYRAATDVRYQSLTGETWASLRKIPGGVLPFNLKKCYEIKFVENGSFAVGNVDNCTKKTGKRLLFLSTRGKENCLRNPFKCVEIYHSLPKDDVITSVKLARKKNPDLLGLVPFDKDHPPENLWLHRKMLTAPTVVMAVKYKFIYKYGTVVQQYTSKRFSVTDPEYDCLGYDIKSNKIVTFDCHIDKGCPVCSHHAT